MPVTKTAKRALRGSRAKTTVNKLIVSKLEIAVRKARKSGSQKDVSQAFSVTDKAAKKKLIHRNKAARIKSQLAKLLTKKPAVKKTSKKKTSKK